ncbi:hypothetical protein AJ78_01881 [Emergomyces pasteurianus Ep9510]|uniref:HTH psq-type domain-containing protein n=1 Tax=Emergomyces pasteurianus Ep9510 TaxID=1447872 RepID=A0A1J9QCX0_9EURO|nr:hypothetical protein AJ78_01881 [Emergomyces pasteurianus Ep9510]
MAPGSTPHSVALRIQALSLIAFGIPIPEIESHLQISKRTLYAIRKKAFDRGFNPAQNTHILLDYVEDEPRSGRPKEIAPPQKEQIIMSATKDLAE